MTFNTGETDFHSHHHHCMCLHLLESPRYLISVAILSQASLHFSTPFSKRKVVQES